MVTGDNQNFGDRPMANVAQLLKDALGEAAVLDANSDLSGFTSDWFGRYTGSALCVVLPSNREQVVDAVKICAGAGVAIIPQGGNTSVCGASVPYGVDNAVIISMSRMNRIREIDLASNAMIVEAGCVLAQVQQSASEADRKFPLSLSAEGSCQIGGTIATNAGGIAAVRYGTMRDLVIGLEVVLPDGQVWDGLKLIRKDSTGFDTKSLWMGTEGALGIITAASIKLFPATRSRAVAWAGVGSVEGALSLLQAARMAFDAKLTAFELMSRSQTDMAYAHVPGARNPLETETDWTVLIELCANDDEEALVSSLETFLGEAMEDNLVLDAAIARSAKHADDFWHIRHSLSDALKASGVSLTHDVAVPISRVAAYIEATDAIVRHEFPEATGTVVCHLGDGNVHYNLTFARDHWAGLADPTTYGEDARRAVQRTAVEMGGTFVAEHGIGRKNRAAAGEYKSPLERKIFGAIKLALDPTNMMNPGSGVPG
ncbi:MAG: FAD-binding oxidoreductase [Mesorhizobium sp.]